MNPAELYAELKLTKYALDAVVRQAEQDALDYAQQTRSKTLDTDRGTVSLCRRRPSIHLDEQQFLQWVKDNAPTEIVETVQPAYAEKFRKGLRIIGDDVLTTQGEVLDFASVREGISYLSARLADEDKQAAIDYVAEHLDGLLLREVSRG